MPNFSASRFIKSVVSLMLLYISTAALAEAAAKCPSPASALAPALANFKSADTALNAAWAAFKAKATSTEFQTILQNQRNWLNYRDAMSANDVVAFAEPADLANCADYHQGRVELTKGRTQFLKGLTAPAQLNWSGVYRDTFGGYLSLEQIGDQLNFSLDVVRGPTFHTGEYAAVANLAAALKTGERTTATFTRDLEPETGDAAKTLLFSFDRVGNRITLKAENAEQFAGARAYFEGDYVYFGPLSAKEKTELREKLAAAGGE